MGKLHDPSQRALLHLLATMLTPGALITSLDKEVNLEELKKEYDLIKQKKSRLTARQRRQVVRLYEKECLK